MGSELTVCIIAKNAEKHLPRALQSVKTLTSNIIVVIDSLSSDATAEICRKYHARIYHRKFDDFSSQKQFAADHSHTDWVLSLDADEEIAPQLASEITAVISNTSHVGFYIKRQNFIFGRLIRHTNWDEINDSHLWLFRRTKCHWQGSVHEEVSCVGSIGRLTYPKLHYPFTDVSDFFNKLNQYTSLADSTKNPFYEFARRYFYHLGFLDGWHGLFLSYLMFIYQFAAHIKLWEKRHLSS